MTVVVWDQIHNPKKNQQPFRWLSLGSKQTDHFSKSKPLEDGQENLLTDRVKSH